MGVLWQGGERLDPETIVMILERERRAWLEAANGFEELKALLPADADLQKATRHVHTCRARAEALKRSVQRLCDQFNLPANFPDLHP